MSLPSRTVRFWLDQDPDYYFNPPAHFDALLRDKFRAQVEKSLTGMYFAEWSEEAESCLALILMLDQFPRNIYRGSARMYFGDVQASTLAHLAVARHYHEEVPAEARRWFVMPLMHSENLADQDLCVDLCERFDLADTLPHAKEHREIVAKFGRFPHRNEMLHRASTPAEEEYLRNGGFRG